jgi:hypothetical protein
MNAAGLQKKLIAAARLNQPAERLPHVLEKWIMLPITALIVADHWFFWIRGLWRTTVSCVTVAIVFGMLGNDFENRLLGPVCRGDTTP